jgi:oligoribonuclease
MKYRVIEILTEKPTDTTQYPLIWLDLEMSGLNPETDVILELAAIATDSDLNVLDELPEIVIHQDESLFSKMDQWNQEHHTKSGLWTRVQESTTTLDECTSSFSNWLKKNTAKNKSSLCGNSIWQDRRFLVRFMPEIDEFLHYRMLDVSTLKILAQHWKPDLHFQKKGEHRALEDIRESIEELRFYREHLLKN